jgi:hypothetical protein
MKLLLIALIALTAALALYAKVTKVVPLTASETASLTSLHAKTEAARTALDAATKAECKEQARILKAHGATAATHGSCELAWGTSSRWAYYDSSTGMFTASSPYINWEFSDDFKFLTKEETR